MALTQWRDCSGIHLVGSNVNREKTQDSRQPGRDSKQAYSDCKFVALLLQQPVSSFCMKVDVK